MNKFLTIIMVSLMPLFLSQAIQEELSGSKKFCGAIQANKYLPDDINKAIECIIQGDKDVHFGLRSDLAVVDNSLRHYLHNGAIKKIKIYGNWTDSELGDHVILYTQKGKKNAVLLAKYCQQKISNGLLTKIAQLSREKNDLMAEMEDLIAERQIIENNVGRITLNLIDEKIEDILNEVGTLSLKINGLKKRLKIEATNNKAKERDLNHYLMGLLLGYGKKDIKKWYEMLKNDNFDADKKAAIKFIQNNRESTIEDDLYLFRHHHVKQKSHLK